MRILLTGSNGFVAGALKPMLSNFDIVCFDFYNAAKKTAADYRDALRSMRKADRYRNFDVVIHAGAVVTSQTTDPSVFHWNTVCSEILFNQFKGTKIIFISSNMAVNPANLYGWSKQLAERMLRMISPYHCILRPSAIFGEPFDRSSPLPIVDLIVTGQAQKLYQDYIRDFVHVGDVAKAIKKTIDKNLCGTFNVGTAVPYSAVELAEAWGKQGIPIAERPDTVPLKLLAPEPRFPFDWKPLDPMIYLQRQHLDYQSASDLM